MPFPDYQVKLTFATQGFYIWVYNSLRQLPENKIIRIRAASPHLPLVCNERLVALGLQPGNFSL